MRAREASLLKSRVAMIKKRSQNSTVAANCANLRPLLSKAVACKEDAVGSKSNP